MKTIPFLLAACFLCHTGCNKSEDADIQNLRSVAADKRQPDYIRKSARIFDDFFEGKTISQADIDRAIAELSATRTGPTLVSLFAILDSLEKRLPENLPTERDVAVINKKYGDAQNINYRIAPIFIMALIKRIVPVITYYDEEKGDSKVNGFFSRFEAKYGSTQAGQYWLERFRMEWNQALEARAGNHGKWKSGREKMGLESPWE